MFTRDFRKKHFMGNAKGWPGVHVYALAFIAYARVSADKQGYTPYGYGMDTPVLVRSSVSYGRGWQLLRSRGEKSNASGVCDPPQRVSSCNCSSSPAAPDDSESPMPTCVPTSLCEAQPGSTPQQMVPSSKAVIVFVIDANRSRLRFFYGSNAPKLYHSQLGLAVRSMVSLRASGTTLPIALLASGLRSAAAERWLTDALGVRIIDQAPPVETPAWGSKWAKGSFAKLRVLALTEFERVVLLDTDTIAFASLDHLASTAVTPPAVTFGWKCYPRRELRVALMVLRPNEADWGRARELMQRNSASVNVHTLSNSASVAIYDDLGEGSVWRHLYSRVYELPAGYAALRCSDFSVEEWPRVRVLHDPNLLRKASRSGWREAGMAERLKELDALVANKTSALWALLKAEDAAAPKPARKRRNTRL